MTKGRSQLGRYLVGLLLVLWLSGCGSGQSKVPSAVVKTAVMRQAQQEQIALWQQLAAEQADLPQLAVQKVHVSDVHSVKVPNGVAYEVSGTYRYRVRYAQRSPLKQSRVPFTVIVQPQSDHAWRLLEIDGKADLSRPSWHWQPLTNDVDTASDESAPPQT
ncbi:MAG: hypothetical protein ACFBSG_18425 [Leptolyngbyaceae cyanobacterium]